MLSFGCVPFCVNGSLDEEAFNFRKLFMEVAIDLSLQPETHDARKAANYWRTAFDRLNKAAFSVYRSEQPTAPLLLADLISMESDDDGSNAKPSKSTPPTIETNASPTRNAGLLPDMPLQDRALNDAQSAVEREPDSAAGPDKAPPALPNAETLKPLPRDTPKGLADGARATLSAVAARSPPDAGTSSKAEKQHDRSATAEHGGEAVPMIPLSDFALPLKVAPVASNPPPSPNPEATAEKIAGPPPHSTVSRVPAIGGDSPPAPAVLALSAAGSRKPANRPPVVDGKQVLPLCNSSSPMKTRAQSRPPMGVDESDSSLSDSSQTDCNESGGQKADGSEDADRESEDEVIIERRPTVRFAEHNPRRALRSSKPSAPKPPAAQGARKRSAVSAEVRPSSKQSA
jgi:hypothetical protein